VVRRGRAQVLLCLSAKKGECMLPG